MRNPVLGSKPAQRLPRHPPPEKLMIRDQAAQPIALRLGEGCGRSLVVERPHQDRRVDHVEDVLRGAQTGRLDHRLDTAAQADSALGQIIAPAAQVGPRQRQPRVMLIEPRLVGRPAQRTRRRTASTLPRKQARPPAKPKRRKKTSRGK